jgi:hypothetical protein
MMIMMMIWKVLQSETSNLSNGCWFKRSKCLGENACDYYYYYYYLMININREIQELEQGKTYNYLGIEESEGIQRQQMKERWKKQYSRRLRMI